MKTATSASTKPILNAYVDDDEREIVVWEQAEDGRPIERRVPAEFVTWHHQNDIDTARMRQLKGFPNVKAIKVDGEWIRITWVDEIARRMGRKGMREYAVPTFEGDVDPVRVWLTDACMRVARPRRCYLDIETDSRVTFAHKEDMRVLVWSIADDDNEHVASGVLRHDTDADEKALLIAMWEALANYDQIVAWNGGRPDNPDYGFDFYVITQRSRQRGVTVDWRRWLYLDQLTAWTRMNSAESGAEKESMKLEDIAQAQIGRGKTRVPAFVTERFGTDRSLASLSWQLWEAGGEFRDLLHRYCVEDTALLPALEKKKGYLALFQNVCEATCVFGETRGLFPSMQGDGFMLKLGRDRGYRFATKTYDDRDDETTKFKGAWVMVPRTVGNDDKDSDWSTEQARAWRKARGMTTGILEDVHVADFSGMYPNIILTWNLGEDTKVGRMGAREWFALDPEKKKNLCRSPGTGLVTRTDREAIVSIALRELIRLRKHWKDLAIASVKGTSEYADAMGKSNAYKVIANSFYGLMGQRGGRFFDVEVAESVTQNGVFMIKQTIAEGVKRGMEAIYSDTDSAMVIGPTAKAFGAFCNWCNKVLYPKIAAESGCRDNTTALNFEKSFDRIIFTAGKRYIGSFQTEAKDSKPEIKGLEYKRGDFGILTRSLQARVIDLLMGRLTYKDENGIDQPYNPGIATPTEDLVHYHRVVSQARDYVTDGALRREEVRKSQKLSKTFEEYEESARKNKDGEAVDLAHVGVARELERRGESVTVGTRIDYVVVDGSVSPMRVIPAADYNGELDRHYLWNSVVWPATERLLMAAFPEHDWASWAIRTPKKGKVTKVLPGQLGMMLDAPAKGSSSRLDAEALAVPTYSVKPLLIRIEEKDGAERIERVKAVLKRFPGAREVKIVIALASGAEAVLQAGMRVSPGPAFKAALDDAIASVNL